jgi:hypothetical protein
MGFENHVIDEIIVIVEKKTISDSLMEIVYFPPDELFQEHDGEYAFVLFDEKKERYPNHVWIGGMIYKMTMGGVRSYNNDESDPRHVFSVWSDNASVV